MTVCSGVAFITGDPERAVPTNAAKEDELASTEEQPQRTAWQSVIDEKLVEWGRDPEALAEDELIPPTPAAICRAVEIAMDLRDSDWLPPLRVVPDGDGGVVLERWSGTRSAAFEIDRNGRIEFVACIDGKVTQRFEY